MVAEQFMKDHGVITYKGKLAQIEVDGGFLLEWGKAIAKELKSTNNKRVFELSVPVGNTGVADTFNLTY